MIIQEGGIARSTQISYNVVSLLGSDLVFRQTCACELQDGV